MGSQLKRVLRSRDRLRRKPLQPKNTEEEPKGKILQAGEISGKENRWGVDLPEAIEPPETSLAEELGAVRRRKERLRSEQERTEKLLMERIRILDAAMRELEDRWETQLKMEAELRRVVRLRDLDLSSQISSPLRSLRDRARDAKIWDAARQPLGEEREDGENSFS